VGFARDLTFAIALSASASARANPQPCVPSGPSKLLELHDDRLDFCIGDDGQPCFSFDLASGRFADRTGTPSPPHPPTFVPDPAQPTLAFRDDGISVCRADRSQCKLLPLGNEQLAHGVAVSASGRIAAVWSAKRGHEVRTFDVATGALLGRFEAGPISDFSTDVEFAGETLVVLSATGVPETAWLATETGKRLGELGDVQPFYVSNLHPVHVRGDVWAFAGAFGDKLVLHDVVTGALIKAVKLGPKRSFGHAQLLADGKRIVVVYPDDTGAEVTTIDEKTYAVRHYTPARCH